MTTAAGLLLDTPAARPCTHRREHGHGTVQRYNQDKCRCVPCRKAVADYNRSRRRQVGYGRWSGYVDARPVRAHVKDLMRAGEGWKAVADLAGISQLTVQRLLYGTSDRAPTTRMLRRTADALLDVGIGRRRPARSALWDGRR